MTQTNVQQLVNACNIHFSQHTQKENTQNEQLISLRSTNRANHRLPTKASWPWNRKRMLSLETAQARDILDRILVYHHLHQWKNPLPWLVRIDSSLGWVRILSKAWITETTTSTAIAFSLVKWVRMMDQHISHRISSLHNNCRGKIQTSLWIRTMAQAYKTVHSQVGLVLEISWLPKLWLPHDFRRAHTALSKTVIVSLTFHFFKVISFNQTGSWSQLKAVKIYRLVVKRRRLACSSNQLIPRTISQRTWKKLLISRWDSEICHN